MHQLALVLLATMGFLGATGCQRHGSGGDETENGGGGPAAYGSIGFSNLSGSGFTVSWTGAMDSNTVSQKLSYHAVISNSADSIATIELVAKQSDENVLFDWTPGKTSHEVKNLEEMTTYYVTVLVKNGSGRIAQYKPQGVTTLDARAPKVGNGLSFSNVNTTSMTVSWGVADDEETPPAYLRYKLVRAANLTDIDTVDEVDQLTGAGVILGWVTNTTTANVTGLLPGVTYAFAVLVSDANGNLALYTPHEQGTIGIKKIFVTDATFNGNFGGIAAADVKCNEDLSKPKNGLYKAMLVDGVTRRACATDNCGGSQASIDWVMRPNYQYIRADGTTPIGTANKYGTLNFPLTNSITTVSTSVWTGLSPNWRDGLDSCINWTADTGAPIFGSSASDASAIGTGAVTNDRRPCDELLPLYCVEQ